MDEARRQILRQMALTLMAPIAASLPAPSCAAAQTTSAGPAAGGPPPFTRALSIAKTTIVRKPADLIEAHLVPPISKDSIRQYRTPATIQYVPGKWPSRLAMASDEEAAIVNNATGQWLAGGAPDSMLAWAKSAASLPYHQTDPETGRLWSIEQHPTATSRQDLSLVAKSVGESRQPLEVEGAHLPSLAYVAYLATGDTRFLEEVQFQANYHQLSQNPLYRQESRGLFTKGQMRAYAWALRDTAMAYLATPEGDVPAPLLPKTYWARILDNNRVDFAAKWVANRDPFVVGTHMVPIWGRNSTPSGPRLDVAPWQQDWLGAVMGWMVWRGEFAGDRTLSSWRANYEWHMKQAIWRTDGRSGYPRSRAIQYYLNWRGVTDMASLAAINGLKDLGDRLVGQDGKPTNMHYAQSLRANLKFAVLNGIPGAKDCFAWIDPQVTQIDPKWAV